MLVTTHVVVVVTQSNRPLTRDRVLVCRDDLVHHQILCPPDFRTMNSGTLRLFVLRPVQTRAIVMEEV